MEDNSLHSIAGTRPTCLTLSAPGGTITIDFRLGDVRISEGVKLTDAAKVFWNTCAMVFGTAKPFPEIDNGPQA